MSMPRNETESPASAITTTALYNNDAAHVHVMSVVEWGTRSKAEHSTSAVGVGAQHVEYMLVTAVIAGVSTVRQKYLRRRWMGGDERWLAVSVQCGRYSERVASEALK